MGPGNSIGEADNLPGGTEERRDYAADAKIVRGEDGRASECHLTIDGVGYRFAPLGTMVRVMAQEEISKRRRALWTEAISIVKDVKGDEGKELLVEAYRIQQRTVVSSIEECLAWLVSPEGDRFHFVQSAKKFQPSLSEEKLTEIYDRATASQLNTFREFQYLAYNPDGVESALLAASHLSENLYDIPEDLQPYVETLIKATQRIV